MSQIGLIAPTEQIFIQAQALIDEMGIAHRVVLRHGQLDAGLVMARELEASGVDVLVSRGGTAERILASEVRTPLVEIPISGQDLAQAIHESRRLIRHESPRIAVIPFHGVRDDLRALAHFFHVDLRFYPVVTGELPDIEEAVRQAVIDGADVIIGGASVEMAQARGVPAVLLTSGEISLRIALEEARKVAYARRLEKERAQGLQVVVDLSREGILTLDREGRIQISNPAALRIMGLPGHFSGAPIREILPSLDLSGCLQRGETVTDTLVTRDQGPLMVNAVPILVGDDVSGAVVTVQETQYITDLGVKIRKELYTKGLVASYKFKDILGVSPQIAESRRVAGKYADTLSTVLITGETGTGKELFAQSIHNASPCSQGPFVAINCAALPPSLLESELFGYEEGAFTGAVRKGKPGLFELAHGGTIFLDEISEMDGYGQTRLLRILQERRSMRLGGGRYVPLDVRVLVASNRDIKEMVRSGEFREDLYYRINLLTLHLPPLRAREGDIAYLIEHFSAACGQKFRKRPCFSADAVACLQRYSWPGNVRELQNVVERLCLSSPSLMLDARQVEEALGTACSVAAHAAVPAETPLFLPQDERQRIIHALQRCNGNQKQTASFLGMDRGTLARKMRRHGIRKVITS